MSDGTCPYCGCSVTTTGYCINLMCTRERWILPTKTMPVEYLPAPTPNPCTCPHCHTKDKRVAELEVLILKNGSLIQDVMNAYDTLRASADRLAKSLGELQNIDCMTHCDHTEYSGIINHSGPCERASKALTAYRTATGKEG